MLLLLESDWQFRIPHQQSQKYKKPAVKCQTSPFSGGSLGTRLVILHTHTHTHVWTPLHIIPPSQADNFFVPPLNLLSEKLRLSPSIAGITLLAIGNGAPDVFTAYAALQSDDIQLLLGWVL